MVFLIAWTQQRVPAPDASPEEIEAYVESDVAHIITFTIVSSPIGLLWVVYFARLGHQSLRTGVYPPTGTVVVRRTRIRTGKEAVVLGYLSIAFSVLLLASLVLIGIETWYVYKAL